MCCFSRPVESVSGTEIFARASTGDKQFLVYNMKYSAKEDLAMILPIPTPAKAEEDAVKFISLKEYPKFFVDLNKGFPQPAVDHGRGIAPSKAAGAVKLAVVDVGSFEASFVPTVADFKRLDERFRLPDGTWDKLPAYKEYGFAVFKLKSITESVHPMAFEFPRKNAKLLFFPTVHIHDGEVHERADFDHALYLQPLDEETILPEGWQESTQTAEQFIDLKKAAGIVAEGLHCYRHRIHGEHANKDTLV